MRNTFGGEGDVADLLQLFAQMEMDEITCLRLVAARFQETELDDKSITLLLASAHGGRMCSRGQPQSAAT